MANDTPNFDLNNWKLALSAAYAEGADQPYEAKRHILSTILNRAESGKAEFGAENGSLSEVLNKGYYSVSKQSPKFLEAMSGKFADKLSENSYKEFEKILSGILHGKVERSDALFFLTPKEVERIKKTKAMNMDLLEEVAHPGAHIFYRYKPSKPKKIKKK